MSSSPLSSRWWVWSSSSNGSSRSSAGTATRRSTTSTTISTVASSVDRRHDPGDDVFGERHRDQPDLQAVVAEDVGEAGRDDRLEAVVLQRPRRVLARRAGAEVRSGHEDVRALVARLVEHEVGPLPPLGEEAGAEPGALDPLEPVGRDDLVGVDVGTVERDGPGDDLTHCFHRVPPTFPKSVQVRGRREVAGDRGRGGDRGGDEVGAPALALAPLEVAVARARGPLARRSACRGSWPGTSSSRARATRSLRR